MRGDDSDPRFGNKADLVQEEIDKLRAEIVTLRTRIEELERNNRILKQRNYDLTMSYSRDPNNRSRPIPISLDLSRLAKVSIIEEQTLNNDSTNESFKSKTATVTSSQISRDLPDNFVDQKTKTQLDLNSNMNSIEGKLTVIESSSTNPQSQFTDAVSENSSTSEIVNTDQRKNSSIDAQSQVADSTLLLTASKSHRDKRNQLNGNDSNSRGSRAHQFVVGGELTGHKGAIYAAEYSGTLDWLASGSFDKTIRIWDTIECKQIACLEGHKMGVSTLSWEDSGITPKMISGGFDKLLIEWDLGIMGKAMSIKTKRLVQS
ncbi:hypothetical protein BB560_007288, partial [Smittium megazygosporum]